jgi:hypothetical protein
MKKICNCCKIEKEATCFQKNTARKDGLQAKCKSCRKEYDVRNREKLSEYHKQYSLKNKEKIKLYQKEYHCSNKQKTKKYRENNKEKIKKTKKQYRQNNKEKINECRRLKLKNNINFRLAHTLRVRLNKVLKSKSINKTFQSHVKFIGCSLTELKNHLEKQFIEGMNWENYGKWHIDHIKPLSNFDLKDEQQVKCACHYTNLQPL